jgi:hypothetical protein
MPRSHHGQQPHVPDQAKPTTKLMAAMMKPAPVFFGMWIGTKPFSGRV